MHVRWKRKRHATNRQIGESLCPHTRIQKPWTLTPVMMIYVRGKYKYAWRIGPSIRECCLDYGLAQAAWWWEVDQRFEDLTRTEIDGWPGLAASLLQERRLIEGLLKKVVPKPTAPDRREHERFYQKSRRTRFRLPPFVAILGIQWPCSEKILKAAWRQLALQHHPDRGGSQEDFVRIKHAYEAALQHISD